MAIDAPQTAPTGAIGRYHKILKWEALCTAKEKIPRYQIWVGFYTSAAQRDAWAEPLYTNMVEVLFSDMPVDPRGVMYDLLMASPLFAGTNAAPALEELSETATLDQAKLRKVEEINRWKLEANTTSFMFEGKRIAYDRTAQLDIAGVNGKVTLSQSFPENWPGGWKTMDNSYVAIPDIATWINFYDAMVNQGSANFKHAQDLKALVAAATTVEEVFEIVWTTQPPAAPAPDPVPTAPPAP